MRLGLGSYAFRWALGGPTFSPAAPQSLLDLVHEAGRLSCEVLQIADNVELDAASGRDLDTLHGVAADLGLDLQVGLTTGTPERLERYLEIGRTLRCDVVRLVLEDGGPDSPEVAALRAVAPRYEDAGIAIGIENHFTMSSSRLIELVHDIGRPSVGVILDVANSILSKEWPERTVELLAPRAVGVHLKDYRLVPDRDGVGGHLVGAPLGEGLTDIASVLEAVRPRDDDGRLAVVVEQWAPRLSSDEETLAEERAWRERSVRTARRWIEGDRGMS